MKLRVKHDWFFGGGLCLHTFWTRNLYQLLSPSTPSHVLFPGLSRYNPSQVMLLSFVVLQWLFIMWRIEFRHQRAIACLAPPLSHPVLQPEWTRWYLGLAYPLQCQWLTPLLACRFPNSSLNLHSTCPGPFTSEPVIPSIFPDSGHSSPALGNLISPLGTCGYALPSAFVFIKYPCLMLWPSPPPCSL